jgi:hypothetical protein
MSRLASFAEIHAQKSAQAVQQQHAFLLRQLLGAFDPQDEDATLDYRGILQRVRDVVARELAALEGDRDAAEPA